MNIVKLKREFYLKNTDFLIKNFSIPYILRLLDALLYTANDLEANTINDNVLTFYFDEKVFLFKYSIEGNKIYFE
jgi:hypothetical protein